LTAPAELAWFATKSSAILLFSISIAVFLFDAAKIIINYRFWKFYLPSGYPSAVGFGGDWLRRAPLRSGSSLRSE
jgi:hypothetical protein